MKAIKAIIKRGVLNYSKRMPRKGLLLTSLLLIMSCSNADQSDWLECECVKENWITISITELELVSSLVVPCQEEIIVKDETIPWNGEFYKIVCN